jgi:hypothetical protein
MHLGRIFVGSLHRPWQDKRDNGIRQLVEGLNDVTDGDLSVGQDVGTQAATVNQLSKDAPGGEALQV